MYKQEHIESTAEKLGGMEIALEYAWVHDWLDEMVKLGISLIEHRKYRHHKKALKNQFIPFIKKNYPKADVDIALKIAYLHIEDDMFFIPESDADFI